VSDFGPAFVGYDVPGWADANVFRSAPVRRHEGSEVGDENDSSDVCGGV
jgi:hypothetical protein